jgi:hypothetical protein
VVSVEVDPPTPVSGATTSALSAFFSSGGYDTSSDPKFGNCAYDTHGLGVGQESGVQGPAPNPGVLSITAQGFSGDLYPQCDGTYPDSQGSGTIAGGALIAFAWTTPSNNPYRFPMAYSGLPAPHSIALGASEPLAAQSPSISRAADSSLHWTVSGTPLALEQVVVQLVQGENSITCAFDASAGSGVVPADALLQLQSGSTSFAVYARHTYDEGSSTSQVPTGWTLHYEARAVAETPTGVAKGTLTLQ